MAAYSRVAPLYEGAARLWSWGRIGRAKRFALDAARDVRGERWLFLGCGRGEDAIEAARRGVRVTALDACPAMIDGLQRRAEREGLDLRCVQGDLFARPVAAAEETYDLVAAHFVLNVFDEAGMREALRRAAAAVAPRGALAIADFAPPSGVPWARAWQVANYVPIALAGVALGLAPLHPRVDYAKELPAIGFRIEATGRFGRVPGMESDNGLYAAWLARRSDPEGA